jgi:hypothetical protein
MFYMPRTAAVYILMAIVCGSCVLRVVDGSTMYGLLYNYNVVALVSAWSPLVLAGTVLYPAGLQNRNGNHV